MFAGIYKDKKVLVTGHTGFKGSWLVKWLNVLGADVYGFSLESETSPNHYELLKPDLRSEMGDTRNYEHLLKFINKCQPEMVFHLAAQPLVRRSYAQPIETFTTNVMGTAHVLEACRQVGSVKAVVNVTTDKCYENQEWVWSYRENEPLGGHDPYSASKACSEIVTSSYRSSFGNENLLIASARAGNVIGGGDWSEDRLVPDVIRALLKNESIKIRSPKAVRPWQHVLEPLSGYLLIGQRLLEGKQECAQAWNFGPNESGHLTVGEVLNGLQEHLSFNIEYGCSQLHEAGLLKLDCSKARTLLKWKPVLSSQEMLSYTAKWYRSYYKDGSVNTDKQIEDFVIAAQLNQCEWVA